MSLGWGRMLWITPHQTSPPSLRPICLLTPLGCGTHSVRDFFGGGAPLKEMFSRMPPGLIRVESHCLGVCVCVWRGWGGVDLSLGRAKG